MTTTWPPSPSVEEEAIALAREHCLDHAIQHSKTENQPAPCRGSVDQYPIILETTPSLGVTEPKVGSKSLVKETPSSDESVGPPTPTSVNRELRYVYIPSDQTSAATTLPRHISIQRSKSTTRLESDRGTRGRPHVSRINTDLGGDLQEMITGRRRAPSPYSFKPDSASGRYNPPIGQGKSSFLSPVAAAIPKDASQNVKRSKSTQPAQKVIDSDSSGYEHHPRSRRDRSRRSSTRHRHHRRDSIKERDLSETELSDSHSTVRHRRTRHHGESGRRNTNSGTNPRPNFRPTTESPYSSTAEESKQYSGSRSSPRIYRKLSRDSEHRSFAENLLRTTQSSSNSGSHGLRTPSRRNSLQRKSKPSLDLSGLSSSDRDDRAKERHSHRNDRYKPRDVGHEPGTPMTARTPKAMEDYLEHAFQENQKKTAAYSLRRSANPSPFSSPPISPPRTPRGDRRSKDYFELSTSSPQTGKPRTRPPSNEDSSMKDLKPFTSLLEAATLGAASIAAKAIPSLSRPSSTSNETVLSGSQSKTVTGQRSRYSSTMSEEPRPLSRASSFAVQEERPLRTASTFPMQAEQHPPYDITVPLGPNGQRPLSRAFSYSPSTEQKASRPAVPFRTQSTAPTGPKPPTQSPVSASMPQVTPTLPRCPRTYPVIGLNDWSTIRHLPYLNFCPSCMTTLGKSRFRDAFVPSPKTREQPVSCSMGSAWIRLAWLQTINQNRSNLSLVQELSSNLPRDTRPCPGAGSDARQWWHLTDPKTNKPIPGFDVCSACVRNIDLLFPELRSQLFDRPKNKLSQERHCNLTVTSKHFLSYIDELDRLAKYRRANDLQEKDIEAFIDHVRKVSQFRECTRNTMIPNGTWHFIPELQEFTICESCFHEVVWPVKDKAIARNISKTAQPTTHVPLNGNKPFGASCQLYSERMREIFLDAVASDNFRLLAEEANIRYEVEQRLHEMQKLIEQDNIAGIDRKALQERYQPLWKSVE